LSIIHAHKGALRWKIETEGVPAHSSTPEKGINAIYKMRRVLECIEQMAVPALNTKSHTLLGKPTLSVGTIAGGSQVNVVPGNCVIEVDRRTIPGESEQRLTEELLGHLDQVRALDPDLKFKIEPIEWYPSFEERTDSPVASLVQSACDRVLGTSRFNVAPWAANSGVFKAAGIPCVLFGPGSVAQAHTREEYIELDQVEKAVGVYAEIIRNAGAVIS
ncbi:MAG TPA: M20/M25/M40 family metallo-hydrolase, partial [bacterium]|nr:M20/M25/M40 family metallo-hydrolase [bacterium]